jgi:hypothetical protein
MPSIINSDDGVVSGSSGLKNTGGNDGILVFQSSGAETARITSGVLSVSATSTAASTVRLYEDTDNGANYVDLVAPTSVASNRVITIPDASGAMVVTGGAQTVEFAAGSASAPSVTFTGDTNTGVYSPGADRIGFAEGGTQVGEFDASGNFKFNSGYGAVATAFGCRAWVNFNGTGTVGTNQTINGSGNVASVFKNFSGDYTVTFTNPMSDANYAYVVTGTGQMRVGSAQTAGNITAGSIRVITMNDIGDRADSTSVSVVIFR